MLSKTATSIIFWVFGLAQAGIEPQYRRPLANALLFSLLRIFHTNINWWTFTGVWVTASLLKSPGLFSVFWLILTVLSFGWSPLVFLFLILQFPWWLYLTHWLQLVPPSPSRSIVCLFFFQFPNNVQVLIFVFALLQFFSVVCRHGKVHNSASSLFFVDSHKVWSSGWDYVIRLYLKVPGNFVRLVIQDRF